jgi:lysophospholipase L1-like esterase
MVKVRNAYVALVLGAFHAAALFAVLNLVVAWYLKAFPEDAVSLTYGERSFAAVYPGRSREDVRQLLLETWSRPSAFDPLTGAKEPPHAGRYVNVHPAGFRISEEQGPWPIRSDRFNVFVFGGSTTFGYGIADGETVPSQLQGFLAPRHAALCYNFGRGGYYSSQERVLFEELLAAGHVPRVAVFVDGLNEFMFDQPQHTAELERYVREPAAASLSMLWRRLPVNELIAREKYRRRLRPARDRLARYDDPPRLARLIDRYLANRRAIAAVAAAWGVRPLFVWQPVPVYKYDLTSHLFGSYDFGLNHYSAFGYARMAERLRAEPPDPSFLWAADMQEGLHEPLYVDQVHYTAAMAKRLAEEIGRALLLAEANATR